MAGIPDVAEALLFLLDPSDLKSARLVCRDWDTFIKNQLWGRGKNGRKQLENRLERRWKEAMPWRRAIQLEKQEEVVSVCCNEVYLAVFVGVRNGHKLLRLYDLVDLLLWYERQVNMFLRIGSDMGTGYSGICPTASTVALPPPGHSSRSRKGYEARVYRFPAARYGRRPSQNCQGKFHSTQNRSKGLKRSWIKGSLG